MVTIYSILIAIVTILGLIGLFNFVIPGRRSLEHRNKNYIRSAIEGIVSLFKLLKK